MTTALARTLDAAWEVIETGRSDADAPGRHPVLATVAPRGAEARMVVLRDADRGNATLSVYTDAATAKVADIRAEPGATLLFWDPRARLQVRCRVTIDLGGPAGEWQGLSARAKELYGGSPLPGMEMSAPSDHRPAPEEARFLQLTARIDEIETLRLGTPHERARFDRRDGFEGRWIAP